MKPRLRSDDENLEQLVEVLDNLHIGIEAFEGGKYSAWMTCSVCLAQLLTDNSSGNKPLAARVISDLKLHPLKHSYNSGNQYLTSLPGMRLEGNTFEFTLFDLSQKRIPYNDWLDQNFGVSNTQLLSLRDLIVSPRNQGGGVHFDKYVGREMQLLEKYWRIGEQPAFRHLLYSVAKYIHNELTASIMGALGMGYIKLGLIQKAQEFIDEALELSRKAGNLQGISYQLGNLGYLHHNFFRQYEDAAMYYSEALEFALQIEDKEQIGSVQKNLICTYSNLGNEYFGMEQYERAITIFRLGLSLSCEINSVVDTVLLLANLALTYCRMDDVDSAVMVFLIVVHLNLGTIDLDTESTNTVLRSAALAFGQLWNIKNKTPDFSTILRRTLESLRNGIADNIYGNIITTVVDPDIAYSVIVARLSEIDTLKKSKS